MAIVTKYIKTPVIIDNSNAYLDFANSYIYLSFSVLVSQNPNGTGQNRIKKVNDLTVSGSTPYLTETETLSRDYFHYSDLSNTLITLQHSMFDNLSEFSVYNTVNLERVSQMSVHRLYVIIRYKIDEQGNVIVEENKTITHIKLEIEQNNLNFNDWYLENVIVHSLSRKESCPGVLNIIKNNILFVEKTDYNDYQTCFCIDPPTKTFRILSTEDCADYNQDVSKGCLPASLPHYTVTVNIPKGNGKVNNKTGASVVETVEQGSSITITITANKGYVINFLKEGETIIVDSGSSYSFTLENVLENKVYDLEFKKKKYIVSVQNDTPLLGNIRKSINNYETDMNISTTSPVTFTVSDGDDVVLFLNAFQGYVIDTVTGGTLTNNNQIRFENIDSDKTVIISFKQATPANYELILRWNHIQTGHRVQISNMQAGMEFLNPETYYDDVTHYRVIAGYSHDVMLKFNLDNINGYRVKNITFDYVSKLQNNKQNINEFNAGKIPFNQYQMEIYVEFEQIPTKMFVITSDNQEGMTWKNNTFNFVARIRDNAGDPSWQGSNVPKVITQFGQKYYIWENVPEDIQNIVYTVQGVYNSSSTPNMDLGFASKGESRIDNYGHYRTDVNFNITNYHNWTHTHIINNSNTNYGASFAYEKQGVRSYKFKAYTQMRSTANGYFRPFSTLDLAQPPILKEVMQYGTDTNNYILIKDGTVSDQPELMVASSGRVYMEFYIPDTRILFNNASVTVFAIGTTDSNNMINPQQVYGVSPVHGRDYISISGNLRYYPGTKILTVDYSHSYIKALVIVYCIV